MTAHDFSLSSACRWAAIAALAGAALLTTSVASAAPCAGFVDVLDTSGFCKNVDWLKNRSITLGCTDVTHYCPTDPVSRLAMAAFMNRLGTALTPLHFRKDVAVGALDLDANVVVCQTSDIAVTGFPRRAFADLTFSGTATADVSFAVDLAMSTDGGATWTMLNANPNRGSVPANQWGGLSDVGSVDVDVGQTVRFGAQASRGGIAGATDLTDSRCELRVLVYSRDGTSSPF
jgi:hypothetical protein